MKGTVFLVLFVVFTFSEFLLGEVAILFSPTSENYYGPDVYQLMFGKVRAFFEEIGLDYIVVNLKEDSIPESVKVVVDPSNAALSNVEVKKVEDFLTRGGKVIAAYESGLRFPNGKLRSNFIYGNYLGINFVGWKSGGFNYMKLTDLGKEVFKTSVEFIKMPRGFSFVIKTEKNARILATWSKDLTGTPPDKDHPAACVMTDSGVYFTENIFYLLDRVELLKVILLKLVSYLSEQPMQALNPEDILRGKLLSHISRIENIVASFDNPLLELDRVRDFLEKARSALKGGDMKLLKNMIDEIKFHEAYLTQRHVLETRGLWIDNIAMRKAQNPEQLRNMVRHAKDLGFNAIFPEVIYRGFTISKKIASQGYYKLSDAFKDWAEDPLEIILEEAHKLGLEVHAWCWVYAIGSEKYPSNIMVEKPDWLDKSKDGSIYSKSGLVWLSHSNPEVKDFLIKTFLNLLESYDLDGLNLDYIRYGDENMGYDDHSIRSFIEVYGVDPRKIIEMSEDQLNWLLWREEKITEFLEDLNQEIEKSLKRDVKLSVDVYPTLSGARLNKLQNWEAWIKLGYIDILIPMDYRIDASDFDILIDLQSNYKDEVYIYPGIQIMKVLDDDQVISQVDIVRKKIGHGFVVFSYSHLDKVDEGIFRKGLLEIETSPVHSDFPILLKKFNEEFRKIIDNLHRKGSLSEREIVLLTERWSEFVDKTDNWRELFEEISDFYFFVSDNIENPKAARILLDEISWMLDLVRPRIFALKPDKKYTPEKPEGMAIVKNPLPIPEATAESVEIKIDGNISDWKDIAWLGPFLINDDGKEANVETYVKVAHHGSKLYVLFKCEEPDFEGAKIVSGARDTRTYLGDSVEVFIMNPEVDKYYHFVIGIDGTLYDEVGYDCTWNGDIDYRVWKDKNNWYVEMGIDLESMNIPDDSKTLRVNFTRNRWRGAKPVYLSWSVTYGSYHNPRRFGILHLKDD